MEQVKIFDGRADTCGKSLKKWFTKNADKINITRIIQSPVAYSGSLSLGAPGVIHISDVILHISVFYKDRK